MNFDLSEEQQVVADLARQLFDDLATPDRVRDVERSGGFDRQLWGALAAANLLALCLPEAWGGSGHGIVELALMAEAQGRRVAPVPLVPTVAAAIVLAESGGETIGEALGDGVGTGAWCSPPPSPHRERTMAAHQVSWRRPSPAVGSA